MNVQIVHGDLLDQAVDVIVNPWNQNIIPSWLLIPHGVSGKIKEKGGNDIFRELDKQGFMPLGKAVYTSAGKLPFRAIIHVACISLLWRTSEAVIRDATKNAMALAEGLGVSSLAFPIIGSGSAGFDAQQAENIMVKSLELTNNGLSVSLVRYKPTNCS